MSFQEPKGRIETLRQFLEALKRIRRERWGEVSGYFFILPFAVFVLGFSIWPIIRGLMMAFQDYRLTSDSSPFIGLANFKEVLFQDPKFWWSLGVSLKFALLTLPPILIVAMLIAILISKIQNNLWATIFRTINYLPVVIPVPMAIYLWKSIYNADYGYLNYFLTKVVGLNFSPIWLGDPKYALFALAIACVWKGFGGTMLFFLVGLYNVPRELYEAARLDGAGEWHQFLHITIPMIRPILTLIFVLNAGILGAGTVEAMNMVGVGPENSTLLFGLYSWKVAFEWGDLRFGYSAAMGLLLSIFNISLALIIFKLMRPPK